MKGPSILFFIMVFALISGLSTLTFLLLRKVFPLYRTQKLGVIFWLISCLVLCGAVAGWRNMIPSQVAAVFIELAVMWFMAEVILVLLLAAYNVIKVILRHMDKQNIGSVDVGRRHLLKIAALSLPAAAIGIGSYGTFYSSRKVVLLQHDVKITKLPATLNGFKIAQLSDVHLGLFFSIEKLRSVLDQLLEHKPDVLVITGDLVDDLACLPQIVALFNDYFEKFPRGIWFSWGNHEYFRDFAAVDDALRQTKVHVLRNENALLVEAEPPLYILGVDYPWAKDAKEQIKDCKNMLDKALCGVPKDAVKILLSHHSIMLDAAYDAAIDLSLMGHTHGGQVALFGQTILPVKYKYMRGMYRCNDLCGYVSAGTGSWFPFRLGCPAETTIFTLKNLK